MGWDQAAYYEFRGEEWWTPTHDAKDDQRKGPVVHRTTSTRRQTIAFYQLASSRLTRSFNVGNCNTTMEPLYFFKMKDHCHTFLRLSNGHSFTTPRAFLLSPTNDRLKMSDARIKAAFSLREEKLLFFRNKQVLKDTRNNSIKEIWNFHFSRNINNYFYHRFSHMWVVMLRAETLLYPESWHFRPSTRHIHLNTKVRVFTLFWLWVLF